MEQNPYILQHMQRTSPNSFLIMFFNSNFGNCYFNYKYGPNERVNFYNEDMTEVTVDVATYLRDAMNHVFNEVE